MTDGTQGQGEPQRQTVGAFLGADRSMEIRLISGERMAAQVMDWNATGLLVRIQPQHGGRSLFLPWHVIAQLEATAGDV